MTRTSPLATGSAEFGSQDSPCGSELSHGVEAVEQEWMVTWHILSPLLFVSCTFHGEKLMLPALQAGLGELNIFFSNGWQKREMVFSDV